MTDMLEAKLVTRPAHLKENLFGDILTDEIPNNSESTEIVIVPKIMVLGHFKKWGGLPILKGNYLVVESNVGRILNYTKFLTQGSYQDIIDFRIESDMIKKLREMAHESLVTNEAYRNISPELFKHFYIKTK